MVQYNTFFVPLRDGGEAQAVLNAFLRSHRVLQVEKNVFTEGWGFCVEWMEGSSSGGANENWRKNPRIDYREVLEPVVFERFAKLRERRKAIAAEEGIPPYMIMTDAQLAELAKREAPQIPDLNKIEGVGDARITKYGERLLTR